MTTTPKPGDWVSIRAEVLNSRDDRNVRVKLRASTHWFEADIRPDLCEKIPKPIQDEPKPGSAATCNGLVYQRFDNEWVAAGCDISEGGVSWEDLHLQGDVQVIYEHP